MHRWLLRITIGSALLLTAPLAAHAQSLLFDYVGFDYESPNPNPSEFGEPGSSYVGLGLVPGLFAPLVADTANNQYTYVITGLAPLSRTTFGSYVVVDYGSGTLSIYEDSKATGTPADYGSNPPNGTAPASFSDGTPFLVGTLTNFQFVFNAGNGTGSYEGTLNFFGGSQIGNFQPGQESGWTFAGSSGNALNIPPGYAHQIDGQAFANAPLATKHVSWGTLKNVYRAPAVTRQNGGGR